MSALGDINILSGYIVNEEQDVLHTLGLTQPICRFLDLPVHLSLKKVWETKNKFEKIYI